MLDPDIMRDFVVLMHAKGALSDEQRSKLLDTIYLMGDIHETFSVMKQIVDEEKVE